MVGLVIGKGSETIKSIALKSNCKIFLFQKNQQTSNIQSSSTRLVEVIGSETEAQIAKDLILELIEGFNNNTLNKQQSYNSDNR